MTKERVEAALNELESALDELAKEVGAPIAGQLGGFLAPVRMLLSQMPSLTPAQPAEELQ